MLLREILQGLQDSSAANADVPEEERMQSLQVQSFLKQLQIQINQEEAGQGALLDEEGALAVEEEQLKAFMLQLQM